MAAAAPRRPSVRLALALTVISGWLGGCALVQSRESRANAAVERLADPRPDVRENAAAELGRLGAAAVPSLVAVLKTDDENLRYLAVRALGDLGPDAVGATPALVGLLHDDRLTFPAATVDALIRIGDGAVPALVAAARDPDELVRFWAVCALGRVGAPSPAAVPGLVAALDDPSAEVSARAEDSLVRAGESAVGAVVAALEDPDIDPDAEARLARILGRIRTPAAAEALKAWEGRQAPAGEEPAEE